MGYAPHDVAPQPDRLRYILEHQLPGGEHILPHLDEGPHHLVIVEDVDNPDWVAKAVLDAYPGRRCRALDETWSYPVLVTVHAVPKFAAEMIAWHTGEHLSSWRRFGPFPEPPTDLDLARTLPQMLTGEEDAALADLAARIAEADQLTQLLALLCETAGEDVRFAADVRRVFEAFLAAISD